MGRGIGIATGLSDFIGFVLLDYYRDSVCPFLSPFGSLDHPFAAAIGKASALSLPSSQVGSGLTRCRETNAKLKFSFIF